ncbi:MAG TPA: PQQ-binding-like beta-propeller repeat protein [Rhizomicrobium sp.]
MLGLGRIAVAALAVSLVPIAAAGGSGGIQENAAKTQTAARSADIDWPHFRFDKNHTGYQPFETTLSKDNIASAELLWEDDLDTGGESFVYFSSPAVVNGVVYIGTDDGYLFAYSADGCGGGICETPLWKSTYIPQVIDSPAVANGIVYVGSQTNYFSAAGKLDAFAADGCGQSVCAPLWQGDAGPDSIIESSPAVWKGLVFVGAYDGKLYAFNAQGCGKRHCTPVWVGTLGAGTVSSPVIYKRTVFIGANDGKLYAFNATGCGKSTCKPLWTGDFGEDYGASPSVSNDIVYIASSGYGEGHLSALSAFAANGCGTKSCTPLWQGVLPQNYYDFTGSPAIAHGRVYVPAEADTNGVAVYPAAGCGQPTCNMLWMLDGSGDQSAIESSPTIANGVVYAGRNTGEVLAWADPCRQQECEQIWTGVTAAGQIVNSSPTVVNGKIYIGSSDLGPEGILYVYGLPQ